MRRMYSGELILAATGEKQSLSDGIGDRVKNQPTLADDLIITANDNSADIGIGGWDIEENSGTPLKPNERYPIVLNNIDLDQCFVVGTAGDGIRFSYAAEEPLSNAQRRMVETRGSAEAGLPLFGRVSDEQRNSTT